MDGLLYYYNLVSGGQSFTRPSDGTIENVDIKGGCVEGDFIGFGGICTPQCGDHYGPSDTELTCDGIT